ncbi:Os03g0848250 [Oryza sativa Japonica Group]|uniref:Os03g0848250 protein n=1 Tax=Oryza sativa subsp. japonica TaxID=39947 RepID=A0A0P0W5X4_ORYSJ|nr:hypothetical protein EE612_021655 [Oryza sativa]BAS87357.1 Os03g0848250 [Oryza sativa Japonica Group]
MERMIHSPSMGTRIWSCKKRTSCYRSAPQSHGSLPPPSSESSTSLAPCTFIIPARLIRLMDGRGVGEGAGVAVCAGAIGEVQVGVADVAEEEDQVGLVAHHVLDGGGGVVRQSKVPDDGDLPRVAPRPDGRHRAERVDVAHRRRDRRVAALVELK